jgi:hypothetical protein
MKDDSVGLDYGFPASMKAPSNAPALRGGGNRRPLESLGAHYYMGNAKIATMFASHEASGKRRWAALGDWTSWSDGGYLGANSENSQPSCGENRA